MSGGKSSEDLALEWEETYQLEIKDLDIDFVYISVLVLASRLVPQHILLEDLNYMMQDGYRFLEQNQHEKACDLWWELWEKTFKWLVPDRLNLLKPLMN